MSENENIGEETTFWKFLKENKIKIPIIQRDYAQGREDEETIRGKFVVELKGTIASDSSSLQLFDFCIGILRLDSVFLMTMRKILRTFSTKPAKVPEILFKSLGGLEDAVVFFFEVSPCGVVGSFLFDKFLVPLQEMQESFCSGGSCSSKELAKSEGKRYFSVQASLHNFFD